MTPTPPRSRRYLGTHRSQRCHNVRVRVYDWLPSPVLCAKCAQLEAWAETQTSRCQRLEARARSKHPKG